MKKTGGRKSRWTVSLKDSVTRFFTPLNDLYPSGPLYAKNLETQSLKVTKITWQDLL